MTSETNYLSFLYHNENGKVSDLKEKFGEDGVRQMETMGYIVNAPARNGDTWRRSRSAQRLAQLRYRKSTIAERITDWFNINVRRIDYSI